MTDIHISQARSIMRMNMPFSVDFLTADARCIHIHQAVSLKWDPDTGTRTIKNIKSGQIRRIRDVLILRINDIEIYV